MYVWSTLLNELCAELETDKLDEEPSKAPLPLANGPAGAASYYSLVQMEKAYYLGQKAAASALAASTPEKEKRGKGQTTPVGTLKACPKKIHLCP
eukprot:1204263-Rhodomonas_salina.1